VLGNYSGEEVQHLLFAKICRKSSYDQGSGEYSLVMGEITSVTVDSVFMTSGIQVIANASGH
jgi:repressor of nif and glnA expression